MSNLPTIRARLETEDRHVYATYWSEVILSLPSTFTLQAIVASLFSSLSGLSSGIDPSPHQRTLVKREAALLREIVAPLKVENQELWDCISALILGRDWSEGHGRILTCWAAGTYTDGADQEGMCMSSFSSGNLLIAFISRPRGSS
jgi:telomere length regulation protein